MSASYKGGCGCGALRYEVVGEPIMANDCQCRQCQRDSGTGHASYLTFQGAEVTITGEAGSWDFVGDEGTVKSRAFCPTCGTPVYLTFKAMPDIFILRPGTLDDPSVYQPQMVFWTETAQPWDLIEPALTRFDRMPPNFKAT